MAKALFGHLGVADNAHLLSEIRQLKTTVQVLESEIIKLRADYDRMSAAITGDQFIEISMKEPALT